VFLLPPVAKTYMAASPIALMGGGKNMKRSSFSKRRAGLARVSKNRANIALRIKKRQTKLFIWEQYGLKKPSYVRYVGLLGVYWYLFSMKVRQRDFKRFGGECIDQCGGYAESWHNFDAGHFVAASKGGFGLLLDEVNVNGQLKRCNNSQLSPNTSVGYKKGLDKRYGPGTADALKSRTNDSTPEWSEKEYDEHIRALMGELRL
jgi:hypothetical protein